MYFFKVERYLVGSVSVAEYESDLHWDILCHYLPKSWINKTSEWPAGEYLLPIGRRSGLNTRLVTNVVELNNSQTNDKTEQDEINPNAKYECPDTFNRTRFTFISMDSEIQTFGNSNTDDVLVNVTTSMSMEFCLHSNAATSSSNKHWPAGDYCIYTMNSNCPANMRKHVLINNAYFVQFIIYNFLIYLIKIVLFFF